MSLERKIALFLEHQRNEFLAQNIDNSTKKPVVVEAADRQKVIDYFKTTGGLCVGQAGFWSYAKRLSDEPITDPNKPRDDIHYFNRVIKLLDDWDGETPFSTNETEDIHRFISHILFIQRADLGHDSPLLTSAFLGVTNYSRDNIDLNAVIQDTENRQLRKSYSLEKKYFTRNMLGKALEKIIHPKTLFLLGVYTGNGIVSTHAIGVYQSPSTNQFYLYDANNSDYEEMASSMHELTDLVWERTSRLEFMKPSARSRFIEFHGVQSDLIRILDIYSFNFLDDQKFSYPYENELECTVDELKFIIRKLEAKYLDNDKVQQEFISSLPSSVVKQVLFDKDMPKDSKTSLINYGSIKIETCPIPAHIHRDSIRFVESQAAIRRWYEFYQHGFIDENDLKSIPLMEALVVISEFPSDKALAYKILRDASMPSHLLSGRLAPSNASKERSTQHVEQTLTYSYTPQRRSYVYTDIPGLNDLYRDLRAVLSDAVKSYLDIGDLERAKWVVTSVIEKFLPVTLYKTQGLNPSQLLPQETILGFNHPEFTEFFDKTYRSSEIKASLKK